MANLKMVIRVPPWRSDGISRCSTLAIRDITWLCVLNVAKEIIEIQE